jgi:hypothetical protein
MKAEVASKTPKPPKIIIDEVTRLTIFARRSPDSFDLFARVGSSAFCYERDASAAGHQVLLTAAFRPFPPEFPDCFDRA